MKRYLPVITVIFLIICFSSCRNDFEFSPSTGNLQFSKDTVYLDTVFTNIGSSTYNLKVYNRSDEDIVIPNVQLRQGEASYFRLNVDGIPGKTFQNVELLANDSLYIFIETTVDIQNLTTSETQFLYTDVLDFDTDANHQEIPLITLVQDAIFLYPQRFSNGTTETLTIGSGEDAYEIYGFSLEDDELTFTNEKPYVIYGYAAVDANKTLTVQAGTRVYFHENSGIIVANNGSLHVEGDSSTDSEALENEVIFEGDRLEPTFANVPGQWGAVWLTAGSTNHQINHLTIRNATVGILMDSNDGTTNPTLNITNTQIYNCSANGLLGRTAHINAENLVIGNCGQSSLYCNYGGSYTFTHCTFANYWNNGFRSYPTVLIDNYIAYNDGSYVAEDLTAANFYNCIIDGNNTTELILDTVNNVAFNYYFDANLIKFNTNLNYDEAIYAFDDASLFNNVILNQNPSFYNTQTNDYRIDEDSAANGQANPNFGILSNDVLGRPRTIPSDLGAYESNPIE